MMRIGQGYDAHRLVPGRPLVLGGVSIEHETGLLGHSDADVLLHALCDALFGALGEGDLGRHSPDSDGRYKGISSLRLLQEAMALCHRRGYVIGNLDATVVAQRPKLAPHIEQMRHNVADICGCSHLDVNIKATTTEGLGFEGREEGISALAVVLLRSAATPAS